MSGYPSSLPDLKSMPLIPALQRGSITLRVPMFPTGTDDGRNARIVQPSFDA